MKNTTKDAIVEVEKTIDALKRCLELGRGVVSGTPYIVQVGGVSINPEIVLGKTTGKHTFGLPCKVKRFTEEDAKSIAKTVVNGRGERGVAVGWVDATEKLLKSLEDLVEYSKRTINP
jgi:hypothetical protein